MTLATIDVPALVSELWVRRGDAVVKLGAPVLREQARPVPRPNRTTRELVDHMKATMQSARGMGLAAPQVGVSERVVIYRLPEENAPLLVMVNPRIVSARGEQTGPEGCLSMPYLHGDVVRANEIIVRYLDLLGRPAKRRASELEARVIQHEVDHLDGVLFIDRAIPDTLQWHLPDGPELIQPEVD